MRYQGRLKLPRTLAALPLLCACGCFPQLLGLHPAVPAPAPSPAATTAGRPASGQATGPTLPLMPLNLAMVESPQDQISLLSQRLAANDDERKVLAARLAQVETLLLEKERALKDATDELGQASEEIVRTRADLKRMQQEIVDLRDQLEKCKKEKLTEMKEIEQRLRELLKEQEKGGPPLPPD